MSCAEASADRYLGAVAANLEDCRVVGFGGEAMRAAGVELLGDTVAGARWGLLAFLRAPEMWRRLREAGVFYGEHRPAVHVCCDSWTVNKHFAGLAKERGAKVLYYVAPQCWASRPARAERLAELADRVACILPFEPAWYEQRGVAAEFVGHPLFDARHGLPDALPPRAQGLRVAMLAGSRASTAAANLPRMVETIHALDRRLPGCSYVFATTPATHALVLEATRDLPHVTAAVDSFDDVLPTCRAALCVSGTATLHAAAYGVPMVIVYAASELLWQTLGKRIVTVRTFGLVNLLSGGFDPEAHIAPELIPWSGPVTVAADHLAALLTTDAGDAQRAAFAALIDKLRGTDAAARVAGLVRELAG